MSTLASAGGATSAVPAAAAPPTRRKRPASSRSAVILRGVVLALGAIVFLFPFYYMVIGSLQTDPDPTLAGAIPEAGNLTLDNYVNVNERINLLTGLINSGIFTGGVLLCTIVFGVLAGYALAMLEWRGRNAVFALALLVQVIPFQLLQIPLYVLIARDYGLADSHLGMILPFAINSTAVIIFRQYFLQLPKELFEAARIDGAGEIKLLWNIALPLVRPALVTAVLLTFIGPWNEFLWPFLITKDASLQPLAVSLANYISNVASSTDNPFGAILAGAVVLAAPVVVLFIVFQRYFVSTDLGSGVKG
ncbi:MULTISPECIES: carbohydrate ABC transporter permease [Rathayibacter]|jgi:multiple sugar transport system permease protein|uniref:carbohydrate ABC transporter permease n=1 Tax=Rathayibacter TaxID=33886 RepID=UPI000F46872B|nr:MULTISPECIES: carbohydrate ABC transporter permease [Rathayibacter]NQX17383.1 carbohydrate ABC transporter permease [Rathayibacter sp. VKM Ac-2857]TDQ10796.1 multiple sugar transport system permease protein [Rathayibacter sp. PhB1]TDX81506.1 multiple sugar transport system permease protein [Rathayibacter sp. PhB151]MDY0913745.1 carbohydrate ABC transporter permease [Rathayibacter festucae]ROP56512.1 multiple sugar transport system permease protein [Rathayibacter sp. PhB186]